MPRRTLDLGDPYHDQCVKTARLLAAALGLDETDLPSYVPVAFRQGGMASAYTAPALEELGRGGTPRVDVFCPGFTSDCLETLEEIQYGRPPRLSVRRRQGVPLHSLSERRGRLDYGAGRDCGASPARVAGTLAGGHGAGVVGAVASTRQRQVAAMAAFDEASAAAAATAAAAEQNRSGAST